MKIDFWFLITEETSDINYYFNERATVRTRVGLRIFLEYHATCRDDYHVRLLARIPRVTRRKAFLA